MPAARPLVVALALVGAGAAGCGDELIRWVDPDTGGGDGESGPRALAIGFMSEGAEPAFVDLDAAPTLPVIHGLQGGTWTMPTLRIDGPVSAVTVVCTVMSGAVEEVGTLDRKVGTQAVGDGAVEVPYLPIPIHHAPPRVTDPIDDLDGVRGSIACEVTGGGGRAAASYRVVFEVHP